MKKICCVLLLGLLAWTGLHAQSVLYYGFNKEEGNPYTALAGATSLDKMMDAPKDKFPFTLFNATESVEFSSEQQAITMSGIPLGFDFTYEGQVYDKFVVSGMGYICLGLKSSAQVTVDLDANPALNNMYRMVANTIGVSTPVQDTCKAAAQYKGEGEAGAHTMTVEFAMSYKGVPDAVFHYQVKLYEADGKIEMLFDEFKVDWDFDQFAVGLSGADATYYLQATGGAFNDVVRSSSNGGSMYSKIEFNKGLKYTFTPPAACIAPDAVAGLQVTPFSASMILNLQKTSGNADAYMVVASENPIEANPVDGTLYKVGDALAGGTVISVKEELEEDSYRIAHSDQYKNELNSNAKYYYAIWYYNFKCSGDIKYGNAIKAEATTLTAAPASLSITAVSDSEIKLTTVANNLNESVLVAVTNTHDVDQSGVNILMKGKFGIAASDAKVGDTLFTEDGDFGGKVIYVGNAGFEISVSVTDNKIYHFGAFSKGKTDGKYSSLFAQADTITPAKIPFFENFTNMIPFSVPKGWVGTDPQFYVASRGAGIQYTFPQSNEGSVRQTNLVLPPMDYPAKAVRLIMSYNMKVYEMRTQVGYKRSHWAETDSIVFEVSRDGGISYSPAYAITKTTADNFTSTSEYITRPITIKGYENVSQVKLRLRWRTLQQNSTTLTIQSVRIIEVPDCDYPLSVSVDLQSIIGDKALLQWQSGESGENAWNISYAMKEGNNFGAWSEAFQVAQNPYQLKDLAMNQTYKVRVQAVCGVGQTSEWVESSEFTSGWSAPFIEDFNNVPIVMNPRATIVAPNGWTVFLKQHEPNILGDTLKPEEMTEETQLNRSIYYYTWKKTTSAVPGSGNAALTYRMNFLQNTALLRLPVLALDENDNAKLVFSAAFGKIEAGEYVEAANADTTFKMRVLVSFDNGNTFAVKDALQTWDSTALVALGDSTGVEIDLSAYKGRDIVLALAVSGIYKTQMEARYLWIDNVGVIYDCGTAKNLKIENIEKNTASLTWKEDPTVTEWIVKVVNADTAFKVHSSDNMFELTGLDSATFYTVSVAHLCGAEADTSNWASTSFTTAGIECERITDLAVSEITRNSAKLTWNGDALRYKIRLRKAGSSDVWANYTASAEEYVFTALLPATEYEGGVQSVCGEAASDTSSYVNFSNFNTSAVTCFAPEDLTAEPSWNSVKLTWKGSADNYQVAYRKDGSTAILGVFNVEGKTYNLGGLDEKIPYQARVRSACGAGDTSAWSEWISFTTIETPACPVPSDLKAESITENSANLSWACGDADATFTLRFRPSSSTSWDSIKALTTKSYELKDLQANTAYTWSVMSACSENRYSGWAVAGQFTTLKETANENQRENVLQVMTGKGQIHILNPSAMMIDRVRILGTDGDLLGNYRIGSNENIILTTNHSMRVVILLVESGKQTLRYKVLLP